MKSKNVLLLPIALFGSSVIANSEESELFPVNLYGLVSVAFESVYINGDDSGSQFDSFVEDKASRAGIFGSYDLLRKGLKPHYRIEIGLNTYDRSNNESVFLRELYGGVSHTYADILVGYSNTPVKLSQFGVDVFNDFIDMKDLIPGDTLADMIRITSVRYKGFQFDGAAVLGDRSEIESRSGYSNSINYMGKHVSLSYSLDSSVERIDRLHRYVVSYSNEYWMLGFLYASDKHDDAFLLSTSYQIKDITILVRYIHSGFSDGIKNIYQLSPGNIKSLSLGLDYELDRRILLRSYASRLGDASGGKVFLAGMGISIKL